MNYRGARNLLAEPLRALKGFWSPSATWAEGEFGPLGRRRKPMRRQEKELVQRKDCQVWAAGTALWGVWRKQKDQAGVVKPCNTQSLFPSCERYTHTCACVCVFSWGESQVLYMLGKCSSIRLYPQPWTVNFLSKTTDLDKRVLLCCSLNPAFSWNSIHGITFIYRLRLLI